MYEKHLSSNKSSELLQNAYKQNSLLLNSQSWFGKVNKLKECISTKHDIKNKSRKSIIKTIRTSYVELWKNSIKNDKKLRTYCKFKTNFEPENYLSIRNRHKRKFITRLRISAHTLAIERLRYSRPIIPADKRHCPTCPNEVEDEKHFMMMCPAYRDSRKNLFENIISTHPDFDSLNEDDKFHFLMRADKSITNHVNHFIKTNIPE